MVKMHFDEYRKIGYVNPSSLKGVNTPKQFMSKWIADHSGKDVFKDVFEIGHAFHTYILEPDQFAKEVIIIANSSFPEPDKIDDNGRIKLTIKANEKHYYGIKQMNKTKAVILEKDLENIKKMGESILSLNGIEDVLDLENSYIEHSFFARVIFNNNDTFEKIEPAGPDEKQDKMSVLVKTRPDLIHKTRLYDLDLKSTRSVDPSSFSRDAAEFEYDIQAAMGLDIVSANLKVDYETFLFLAVEKQAPHDAILFDLLAEDIRRAKAEYIRRLKFIREAYNSGIWQGFQILANDPDYPLITLRLPKYHADKYEYLNTKL
jgi:hypothetical protein